MRPRGTLLIVLIAVLGFAFVVGAAPALAGTWEAAGGAVNADPTPVDVGPAFAAVGGAPDMAWEEISGGHTSVHAATWNGASWTALGSSVSGSEHADSRTGPAITAFGGTPYVAWTADPAEDGSLRSVYVSAWNGTAWTVVGGALNHDPAHSAYLPTLSVVGGVLYAAWLEDRDGGGDFGVVVSRLVGGAWQAVGSDPAEIDPTRGAVYRPSIADVGGVPWVAYDEFEFCCDGGSQDYSHIRVERLDGNTWTAVGAGSISSANTNGNAVALSVIGGTPTIAWGESNSGLSPAIYDVRVARWDGAAWTRLGGAVNGATATNYAQPVSLAAIDGEPWVGFMQQNGGDDAVVDQWTGAVWQPAAPALHTSIAGHSTKLPVVVAVGGVPWVAWLDDDDEAAPNGQVYAATQALDTQPPVASATITGSGAHVSGDTYGGFVTVAGAATDPPPSSGAPTVRCALDPATPPASYDDLGAGSCTPLVTGLGPHTFYVAARDPAGNTSTVVSVSFAIIPVPDTIITSGPIGNTWTASPSYTFTSTIPGSTFTCSVDGAPPSTCSSPRALGLFAAGSTHTLSVQATSPAGVTDPTPAVAVVHVNATQVSTSQPCEITPFLFISDSDSLSDADPWGCYLEFSAAAPPGGSSSFCETGVRCFFSPGACPAEARCTLTLNASWDDDDVNEPWRIVAESYLLAGAGRYAGGTFDHTCTPVSGKAGCSVHDTETLFGPADTWGNCLADPGYPSPSARFGSAGDRDLRCTMTLTLSPATPLGFVPVGLGTMIFLPSAGKLTLTAGAVGSHVVMARAAKKAAPVFKTTITTVASSRAVKFTPRLSAAAKASLKRHRKLAISIRMGFVPAHGGAPLSRTIRTTLAVAVKPPPKCPAHKPRRRVKKKVVCLPAVPPHRPVPITS